MDEMKKTLLPLKGFVFILLSGMLSCSTGQDGITVDDAGGALGRTGAPVAVKIKAGTWQRMAQEDLLGLEYVAGSDGEKKILPAQPDVNGSGEITDIVVIMPDLGPGEHTFRLVKNASPFVAVMSAEQDPESGQIIIKERDEKVLQYNYRTVYEKDVIRSAYEEKVKPRYSPVGGKYLEAYLKEHPGVSGDSVVTTSIYARPRSDYIHPLYGLKGEMLTRDWPPGEYHHRGIWWAWPEVRWGTQQGDLYALQRIFARPTGNIRLTGGPLYAQIVAENLWMWEDREPVVRELAIIRVYRSTADRRILDITISLLALKDSITIATRFTNSYGAFNLRMQSPASQKISYFTGPPGSQPVRAWSDLSGIFGGQGSSSGLMVLQHKDNPEYPGVWVEYPHLAWVQPAFPSPGTRYPLSRENPLVLRYRLIVHAGGTPDRKISEEL